MRILCLAFVAALAWPAPARAQHSFSLPSIGLPLPPIGLPPPSPGAFRTPWWERQPPPPWERQHVARPPDRRPDRRPDRPYYPYRQYPFYPQFVYFTEPYVIEVPQPPQIIVVQQPPEIRVVEVEVPAPPEPPYVPTGNRTLYMIPGCYVGNVSPKDVKLPAGCDVSKVVTFTP